MNEWDAFVDEQQRQWEAEQPPPPMWKQIRFWVGYGIFMCIVLTWLGVAIAGLGMVVWYYITLIFG